MAVLTLTSDFGRRDGYVGALEGAVRSAAKDLGVSDLQIVNLDHDIPAFDRISGALAMFRALPSWPQDSLHLCVIDPGVGSGREIKAARFSFGWVVAPDNGLFHFLAIHFVPDRILTLTAPTEGSATFEARDRMASAAVALIAGMEEGWEKATTLRRLKLPKPDYEKYRALGAVLDVDRYGTLITNIQKSALLAEALAEGRQKAFVGNRIAGRLLHTFSDAEREQPVVYFGSSGYLEIACREASAAEHFLASRGEQVELVSPVPLIREAEVDKSEEEGDGE